MQPKVKGSKHVYCNYRIETTGCYCWSGLHLPKHLCGAPVCMSMCCFRYCLLANVFSQISHLCCSKFSSWHLITCVFKLSVLLKVLAHIWHVTTLYVWTFWYLAMCPFLNTFPHLSHFISWCHLLLCWFNLDLDRNVFPHSAHAESNMVLTRWSLR